MKLFCDNKANISIANNQNETCRDRGHFIKEKHDNDSICISYIPSRQQVVDVLTKGLLKQSIDYCWA